MKLLSEDRGSGRLALYALLPAGFHERLRTREARWNNESFEVFVVAGEVGFGAERLGRYDFAYSPAGVARPPLSSEHGGEALVFFDPATTDAQARARLAAIGPYVTRYSAERWNPGTLSQAAGVNIDLRIQHLKKDPLTGARTWLVRLVPGVAFPWERHSVVEEGFLLEGRYALPECLPQGIRHGEYTAGGYFYRPGGIPHSGPGSGPLEPSVWLQRSPAQLDVRFFGDCRDGTGTQPVQ